MGEALRHVPVDIETTGFEATDAVTVVGFSFELGCRVFVQTGGRETTGIEAAVRERTGEHVVVSTHRSEAVLLRDLVEFAATRFRPADVVLVGFNGETWGGGFDLPFLRTRYAVHDVPWPFRDVPYADVLPVIRDLFATTVDGEDATTLEATYEVLCGEAYADLDPFGESAEAVTAFEDGRFADLVVHNVADVLRTDALSGLARRYCSKSDFNLKSLTPVVASE